MADEVPPEDQSTPRRQRKAPKQSGVAPGPLLAVMAVTIVMFLVAAWATQQWQFVFLGLFGVAAGALPLLNRRK